MSSPSKKENGCRSLLYMYRQYKYVAISIQFPRHANTSNSPTTTTTDSTWPHTASKNLNPTSQSITPQTTYNCLLPRSLLTLASTERHSFQTPRRLNSMDSLLPTTWLSFSTPNLLVVLVFGQYGKININPACSGGVVGNVIRGEVGEKLWLFLGSVMFSALGVA